VIDVKKVAKLARLEIAREEEAPYQNQMNAVFKYFEEIAAIDTKGVEPLVTPSEIEFVIREDVQEKSLTVEEALANAPERVGNLFKVPPVV
jgi:aspartyl-tRNA(Asn)/glutamyl-tRNA(Gln) amidotransferase subunit C